MHTQGIMTASWNEDGSWVGVDVGDEADPNCAELCTICLENIEEDDESKALERAKDDARRIAISWNSHNELMAACKAAQLALRATSKAAKDYTYELELLKSALSKGAYRS